MSNGDADPLPDDGAPGASKAPTPVRKARAVKPTKKRKAKASAEKTAANSAVAKGKGTSAKSTGAKGTGTKSATAKGAKRTTSAHVRLDVGSSEMFVSRDVADALTDKDLKRLRALFKRLRKRARKRTTKKR